MSSFEGSNPSPSAKSRKFPRTVGHSGGHEVRRAPAGEHGDDALARELGHAHARRPGCAADVGKECGVRRRQQSRVHLGLALVDVEPAAKRRPSSSAIASASSSTTSPRAVFTSTAVGFMSASRRASINSRVSSVSGTCRLTMSDRASNASRSGVQPGDARVVTRVMDHLHAEARGAPRHGLADAAEPDHTEDRAVHVDAVVRVEAASFPSPGADVGFGLRRAPRRREDQEEGEIGGRVVEHAGRVAHRDPERAARRRRRCCRGRPRPCRRRGADPPRPPRAPPRRRDRTAGTGSRRTRGPARRARRGKVAPRPAPSRARRG